MVSGVRGLQITVQSPMKLGMPNSNASGMPKQCLFEKTDTYGKYMLYILSSSNTFCQKVTICVTSQLFS